LSGHTSTKVFVYNLRFRSLSLLARTLEPYSQVGTIGQCITGSVELQRGYDCLVTSAIVSSFIHKHTGLSISGVPKKKSGVPSCDAQALFFLLHPRSCKLSPYLSYPLVHTVCALVSTVCVPPNPPPLSTALPPSPPKCRPSPPPSSPWPPPSLPPAPPPTPQQPLSI